MTVTALKKVFMRIANAALATVCIASVDAHAQSRDPSLSAAADVGGVYLGNAFSLKVSFSGTPDANAAPVFERKDGYAISGPSQMFSTRIINGVEESSVSWQYSVQPSSPGMFSLGPVSISAGGRKYAAQTPQIEVYGPERSDFVAVSIKPSRDRVLVEEGFDIVIEVLIAKLSGAQYADINPMANGRGASPLLLIPYFEAGDVGASRFRGDMVEFLNKHTSPGGSDGVFRINNFSTSPQGFMVMESVPVLFYLSRDEATLEGKPAWRYTMTIPFVGVSEGKSEFGPVRFNGTVYTDEKGGEPVGTSVFVESGGATVEVVPPPAEGRPDSYAGTLGTYMEATASIDAQVCNEGDPLVLTLKLSGDQTFHTVRAPQVFRNPAMAERFRQFGSVGETKDSTGARFTYRIRPIVNGTIEVPPIEVSFYNKDTRKYETVMTQALPLRVNPASVLNPDAIFGTEDAAGQAMLGAVESLSPSGITVVARGVQPRAPRKLRIMLAVGLAPPMVYVAMSLFILVWDRRRSLGKAVRRRSATGRSVRGIAKAKTPGQVMEAVAVVLRDRLGVDGAGFTPREIRSILIEKGADVGTADEIGKLLQEVFDSGFSPDGDPHKVVAASRKRLSALFASLKTMLAICITISPFLHGMGATGAEFTWRQANAAASRAKGAEGYYEAAQLYRGMIDEGASNGPLLYNYGTMLVLAGHPEEGLDALERVEALEGSTPEIEGNMRIALRDIRSVKRRMGDVFEAELSALPWYRTPLFWHFGTSIGLRADALAVVWGLFWAGLLLRRFGLSRTGKIVAIAAALGIAVFGSSVFASWRTLHNPLPPMPAQTAPVQGGGAVE